MYRIGNQLLSVALIITLIITMGPWTLNPAEAAGCDPAADSVYFNFTDFSTCQDSPTQVNTDTVNLAGSFTGVAGSSITFKIDRIVGGNIAESTNGSITPIISGNSFLFTNVKLFDGLNRITVSGVNNAGNIVEGSGYVFYGNVPVITSVQLADGRALQDGVPLIVSSASPSILIKASNATEITVNGKLGFSGGAGTFVVSDLNLAPGRNELVIVARNADKTYGLNRQLIYFSGFPTAYDVKVTNGATVTSLDGKPVVGTVPFTGTISGKLLFPRPADDAQLEDEPGIQLALYLNGGAVPEATFATTVPAGSPTLFTDYVEYNFTASTNMNIPSNGSYVLRVTSTYTGTAGVAANFPVEFTVRDSASPYITGFRQLYSVVEPAATDGTGIVTYSSQTQFSNSQTVFQLPLWIKIEAENFDFANTTTSITAKVNGAAVPAANFEAVPYRSDDGRRVYKITKLPAGEVQLDFTVTRGANSDTVSRTISFIPAPAIQVDNLFSGKIYNVSSAFTTIEGRLVNFNLPDDAASVRFTLNGVTRAFDTGRVGAPDTISNTDGSFVFQASAAGLQLVAGPNEITISATASGVPITTRMTVYLFSAAQPAITNIVPVPDVAIAPSLDTDTVRRFSDPDLKFRETDTRTYTTNENKAELLFTIQNWDSLIIKKDGQDYASATLSATNVLTNNDPTKLFLESSDPVLPIYRFRLFDLDLPTTGPTSITFTVIKNGINVSETITIVRELSPYLILSPKLPNERVINQNFLNVSIQAEGADRVTIGKEEMIKGSSDIFRFEMKNLKKGNNTVKFTVYRGTEKLDGQFTVNYAGDNSIGAQYKAQVPKSGKLNIFNGEITLSFPKDTFLRKANLNPGQDVTTIDLFDSQQILFGIADRKDGRTVKVYNAVGELGPGDVPRDGELINVAPNDLATFFLQPRSHFGFASDLYWIDAGYASGSNLASGGYEFKQGMHPYKRDEEFYLRGQQQWLEPSQRGSITIKYDPGLRNAAARYLGVWRYHNGEWKNLGGVVNTSKKTVTAPFDGFGYYAVKMISYSFSDIISHEYARLSLETMLSRGIMTEKNNNEFGVYDNITRGEFAQMLVKMLDIPLEYDPNNMTFDDVLPIIIPGALWDYRYVETAVKKGIIRGKGPRIFLPNEPLTREEAAVMIARATNLLKGNENLEKDKKALQKLFTDSNIVDNYALSSILAITKAKYITGLPNTTEEGGKPTFRFDPRSNLKRADAAIIVERVMVKMKRI